MEIGNWKIENRKAKNGNRRAITENRSYLGFHEFPFSVFDFRISFFRQSAIASRQ